MIRAIIFDCFGVLVGCGFWDVYRACGGDPVKDNAFILGMVNKANAGEISGAHFSTLMADKLGLALEQYDAVVTRQQQPNRPLLDYIRDELKPHYKLAIISNANTGELETRLAPEDLALFDTVIVSADVGFVKPDPQIFQLAADRLGITFNETVFVDDLERFTVPAEALGLHAIVYTGLDPLKQELATLLN
jgi:epoxide hydrolase-like predicted phosphatase